MLLQLHVGTICHLVIMLQTDMGYIIKSKQQQNIGGWGEKFDTNHTIFIYDIFDTLILNFLKFTISG